MVQKNNKPARQVDRLTDQLMMYQSMVVMTDPLCNEGTNLKIYLIAGIILKCKWDYCTPTCVLCLFSFSCVPISMKLFPSVYACLSSHPSRCPSVCPCIWPSTRLSLSIFLYCSFWSSDPHVRFKRGKTGRSHHFSSWCGRSASL